MTSKRDLGTPLALAGLGIVVVSVIAGFIAVGGPGDARNRRLDDMTMGHVRNSVAAAHCAFSLDGEAPVDRDALRAALDRAAQRAALDDHRCHVYGTTPLPDDVEYSRVTYDRIRVCAQFRRPFDPETSPSRGAYRPPREAGFPELDAARPAGRHCYEVQLVKPDPAPTN